MKTITIENFNSLPASFIEISPNFESQRFTRAKLKVFYVGMTADGRLFTKNFSEGLIKTIAYTPVVSHYNSEKDDFEGHASQQNIYGIVDPLVAPTFIEEDGVTWAVCDVILYTKRPDETGSIAQKIVGHPQSLELKPETVQYKINRNKYTGKFENIEFISGEFIGVSVLGSDQKPAFTGSGFFDEQEFEKFEHAYAERGGDMNLKIPAFVDQSWAEKMQVLSEALNTKFPEDFWYIADMYDTYCIIWHAKPEDSKLTLLKINYTINETVVTLSEPVKVRVAYEEIKEPEDDEDDEDDKNEMTSKETNVTQEKTAVEAQPAATTMTADPSNTVATTQTVTQEEDKVNEKVEKEATVAALSSDELKELNDYRRKDKIDLVHSYSDLIDASELDIYIKNIDTYSRDELTNLLAVKAVEKVRKESPKKNRSFVAILPDTERKPLTKDEELLEYLRNKK